SLKGRSGDDIFFIENPLGELGKGVVTLTKTHSRGFFNSQYLFQGIFFVNQLGFYWNQLSWYAVACYQ
ncbi:MAG TPA: hypothetical protein PKC25_08245, partial [Candidatus Rifleibacterium sp.]|nr:hypothetical protein [Candidatus Rifleibacterium sp.]